MLVGKSPSRTRLLISDLVLSTKTSETTFSDLSFSFLHSIKAGAECIFSLEDRKPPPTRAKIEELEALCSKLKAKCSLLESRLKVADPDLDLEELYENESQTDQDPDITPKEEEEDEDDEEDSEDHILELQSNSSYNEALSNEETSGLVDSFNTQMTVLTDGEDEGEQSHFFGKSSM